MIEIYTDGATEGENRMGVTKYCGIGFYCPQLQVRFSKRLEAKTNNEAEFYALLYAMWWCIKENHKVVRFLLDSRIVVNRANGRRPKKAKFRNPRMDRFQDKVLEFAKQFDLVEFCWIPREHNTHADEMSKKSLMSKRSF